MDHKIESAFENELKKLNDSFQKQVTMMVFENLQVDDKILLRTFLDKLMTYDYMLSAFLDMGLFDFAKLIVRSTKFPTKVKSSNRYRTRLTVIQKDFLKGMIVGVLDNAAKGLNRMEIANSLSIQKVIDLGIDRLQITEKIKQPLKALIEENLIFTLGNRRNMKYFVNRSQKTLQKRNKKED